MRSATASANPSNAGARLGLGVAEAGELGRHDGAVGGQLGYHPGPQAGVEREGMEEHQRGRVGHRADATVSA